MRTKDQNIFVKFYRHPNSSTSLQKPAASQVVFDRSMDASQLMNQVSKQLNTHRQLFYFVKEKDYKDKPKFRHIEANQALKKIYDKHQEGNCLQVYFSDSYSSVAGQYQRSTKILIIAIITMLVFGIILVGISKVNKHKNTH